MLSPLDSTSCGHVALGLFSLNNAVLRGQQQARKGAGILPRHASEQSQRVSSRKQSQVRLEANLPSTRKHWYAFKSRLGKLTQAINPSGTIRDKQGSEKERCRREGRMPTEGNHIAVTKDRTKRNNCINPLMVEAVILKCIV